MKKEFNLVSLAKALAQDVWTSPVRVHDALMVAQNISDARGGRQPDRFSKFMNTLIAIDIQAGCMLPGAMAGALLLTVPTGSIVLAALGALAGASVTTPATAKVSMKLFEMFDNGMTRLFNKISPPSLRSDMVSYPQFEAYPEFNKAYAEMKPQ